MASPMPDVFDNADGRFDDASDDEEEGPLLPYAPGADPDGDLPEVEPFEELFGSDNDDDDEEGPLLPYFPGADPDGDLPAPEPFDELFGDGLSDDDEHVTELVVESTDMSEGLEALSLVDGGGSGGAESSEEDEGRLLPYAPGADPDGDLPEPEPFEELFGDGQSEDSQDEKPGAATEGGAAAATQSHVESEAERRRVANKKKRERQRAKKEASKKLSSSESRDGGNDELAPGEAAEGDAGKEDRVEEATAVAVASAASVKERGGRRGKRLQPGEGRHGRGANVESSGGGGESLFVDQLKLLPFLLRASQAGAEGQLEMYEHAIETPVDGAHTPGGAPPVRIAQYPQGVGCAASAGKAAWNWRVWDAAKAVASTLPSLAGRVRGEVVLEIGAGAGLASLTAARLGAKSVLATDLARALPLLLHNYQLNGAVLVDQGETSAGGVCCPGGHALVKGRAKTEDHMCNVCGLADPLGAGIAQGALVHSCRACDFDTCGQCAAHAAAGRWERVPGWFRLQCEGVPRSTAEWRLDCVQDAAALPAAREATAGDGAAASEGSTKPPALGTRSSQMLVAPWDLLAPSGVAERAAELVSECVARAGGPPSLVLVADVSCAMALIQPLVATLAALGRLLPPGAVAIVAHERREAKVDAAFERALARAALALEVLKVPAASTTDAGGETTANARLRLWKVPLN